MKNRKINVDRPKLKSEEILSRRNFDEVMTNHNVMTKPFYKQNWFIGTTGLASLGLIIGGTLAFQDNTKDSQVVSDTYITDAPPNKSIPENKSFIVQVSDLKQETLEVTKKKNELNPINTMPIEENFTQEIEQISNENEVVSDKELETADLKTKVPNKKEPVVSAPADTKSNAFLDMSPRISDKLGGSITRDELMDNKGITTEGDISIIHFELHLIDGLGGKVFEESGNHLNEEMKEALDDVGKGETIYFENIKGKIKDGREVKLNPLRYVLMN